MAFNFMSFLGGAAGAGSEYIDTKNEADAAAELTKEQRQWQIATEGRRDAAARKLQRDNKRDSTNEYIATLTSLGWDTDRAASIAAGGAANVATWTDIGIKHKQTGKEWDINLLVGNKETTNTSVINEASNDVADPSDTTTSKAAWLSMGEEPEPVFQDLNKSFAFYQNKANNATGAKKSVYQQQADAALASLKAKKSALADEGTETGSPFAPRNIETIRKMNRFNGMEDVGVEVNRTEDRIIKKYGDGGRYNIGMLRGLLLNDAANLLEDGTTVADLNWQGMIKIERENAFAGIKAHARLHITGQFSDDTNVKNQYVNQEKALTIIGQYSPELTEMPDGTPNTEYLSTNEVSKLYQTGKLRFGDTYKYIDSNNTLIIGVYTGNVGLFTIGEDGKKIKRSDYNFLENRIAE
jgi:hypothetical protein